MSTDCWLPLMSRVGGMSLEQVIMQYQPSHTGYPLLGHDVQPGGVEGGAGHAPPRQRECHHHQLRGPGVGSQHLRQPQVPAHSRRSAVRGQKQGSNRPVRLLPLLLQLGLSDVAARDHGVKLRLGGSLGLLGDVRQCADRLIVYPEPVEGKLCSMNFEPRLSIISQFPTLTAYWPGS